MVGCLFAEIQEAVVKQQLRDEEQEKAAAAAAAQQKARAAAEQAQAAAAAAEAAAAGAGAAAAQRDPEQQLQQQFVRPPALPKASAGGLDGLSVHKHTCGGPTGSKAVPQTAVCVPPSRNTRTQWP